MKCVKPLSAEGQGHDPITRPSVIKLSLRHLRLKATSKADPSTRPSHPSPPSQSSPFKPLNESRGMDAGSVADDHKPQLILIRHPCLSLSPPLWFGSYHTGSSTGNILTSPSSSSSSSTSSAMRNVLPLR